MPDILPDGTHEPSGTRTSLPLATDHAGAGRFDVWTVSGERWLYLTPAHVTDDGAFFTDVDGEQVVMALACIVAVMPR